MSTGATDPTEKGQLAAARGDAEATNPYPADAQEHALWLAGYRSFERANDEGEANDFA